MKLLVNGVGGGKMAQLFLRQFHKLMFHDTSAYGAFCFPGLVHGHKEALSARTAAMAFHHIEQHYWYILPQAFRD
jgi:hypothetical protein